MAPVKAMLGAVPLQIKGADGVAVTVGVWLTVTALVLEVALHPPLVAVKT